MRYLLVVGFACDVYRQEPRARIYVGDKLIDEFYIRHQEDIISADINNHYQNNHILKPIKTNNFYIKNLPHLRFYEIEVEPYQNKLELRINIENSDSNYNNGFITKSTLLKLQIFYFFPYNKKLLSILSKMMIKNRKNKNNYAWHRRYKSQIFNLDYIAEWHGKNGKILESTNNNNFKNKQLKITNIGGDGVFTCKLIKKYKIFIAKFSKAHRYSLNRVFIDYLYDKYQQHANQRNSD
jgi:hypothetical protein